MMNGWWNPLDLLRRAKRKEALRNLNDYAQEWIRAEQEKKQAEAKKTQEEAELKRAETQAIIDMAAYLRNKKI